MLIFIPAANWNFPNAESAIVCSRLIIDFSFLGSCPYDILIFDALTTDLGMPSPLTISSDVLRLIMQ